jgi:hypothetical protein
MLFWFLDKSSWLDGRRKAKRFFKVFQSRPLKLRDQNFKKLAPLIDLSILKIFSETSRPKPTSEASAVGFLLLTKKNWAHSFRFFGVGIYTKKI